MPELTTERILELATDSGLGLGIYPPAELKDQGNGTLKFVRPDELTYYGAALIVFAKRIEKEVAHA